MEEGLTSGPKYKALQASDIVSPLVPKRMEAKLQTLSRCIAIKERHPNHVFSGGHASLQMTEDTQCVVYNLQTAAVQRILDFDIMCKRKKPSVSAMVYAFGGTSGVKVYWGTQEIFIPVYTKVRDAVQANPDITVMINFASF